jgi:hypothetical protein
MLVNVLLPAFTPVMVRRGCSSFKRRYACTYTRGSVRRASGFVLTGNTEVIARFPILAIILRQVPGPFSVRSQSRCLRA